MKIGLQVPHFRPSSPETRRDFFKDVAQMVESAGFESIWVMDHFFQLGFWMGEPETDMMEGYTTLGYLAGVTHKIKLGLMVGGVIYRHPAVVVKMISTLDVLSGGRMYFGIGAAWYEKETLSLGMHFPSVKERFERLEDVLGLAHHMFAGKTEPFEGRHVSASYPVNSPQPLQKPHPPILIGGMGPKKTLRMVAQYGDACNFFGGSDEDLLIERLDILKQHCEDLGRDYDEIEKTVLITVAPDDDSEGDPVARAKTFSKMGFTHMICNIKPEYSEKSLKYMTEELAPAVMAI